jgi:hypothetical protein
LAVPEAHLFDPRTEYGTRLELHAGKIARNERHHIWLGNWKLAVVVTSFVLGWLSLGRRLFPGYWLILPAGTYVVLAILHEQTIRARKCAETATAFYRSGFARIDDRWSGTGATGDRFCDPKHSYADDLDLFGNGGLFQLLSTARMPMGEDRLAEWLRSSSPAEAIVERQGLVAELRPRLVLREDLKVAMLITVPNIVPTLGLAGMLRARVR